MIENPVSGVFDIVADQYDFLIDGCMSTFPFIANNFEVQTSRVQWADDDDSKTYLTDQFKVDLWEPVEGEFFI